MFYGIAKFCSKQIFTDKIFIVYLPAMPCILYEFEISTEKFFMANAHSLTHKIFNLEKFRLYSVVHLWPYPYTAGTEHQWDKWKILLSKRHIHQTTNGVS